MSTLVFIDTEFTSFKQPRLLSLGMVTQDGREFYAELDRTDPAFAQVAAEASEFVRDHAVLPQWGRVPGAATSVAQMGERAGRQLLDWARELGDPIIVAHDHRPDWLLLERLLSDAGHGPALRPLLREANVTHLTSQPDGEIAAKATLATLRALRAIGRHHALADALALRAAYQMVTEPREVL